MWVCSQLSIESTVELTINQEAYKYAPWYHYSSGLTVWNSQWTNSATYSGPLQPLISMNCDEPLSLSPTNCHPFLFFRYLTSFHKPIAVCVLWLLFVCIQLSVLMVSEEKKNLIFIEQGKVNFILLKERQEETNQFLGELTYQVLHHSSCYSYIIYLPSYLQFYASMYLPISVTVQILQLTVHNAHRMAQWSTDCCYIL
jgi:hypothetical protein